MVTVHTVATTKLDCITVMHPFHSLLMLPSPLLLSWRGAGVNVIIIIGENDILVVVVVIFVIIMCYHSCPQAAVIISKVFLPFPTKVSSLSLPVALETCGTSKSLWVRNGVRQWSMHLQQQVHSIIHVACHTLEKFVYSLYRIAFKTP